jgi:YVTN family beta-propeller protein
MQFTGKPYTVLLSLFLGSAAIASAQSTKPEVTPPPAAPPITLLLTSLVPDATIELGGDRHFAVTPDGVWVSNRAAGTVTRIDPKTNTPEKPLAIGKEPCHSLVQAFKSLWTALCSSGSLMRLDLPSATPAPAKDKPIESTPAKAEKSPLTEIKTGIRGAGPLVSATGSIWMITDAAGSLVRLDPDTNAVVAEVTVPSGATSLAVSGDALWIVSTARAQVSRVNGYSNVVEETVKVGPAPIAVAAGEGSIWTLNGGDGSVSRIDPKTNKVTDTIKVGATGTIGTILAGEGSVWVSVPGFPLSRIDPRTNRLAQQFTGPGGGVLAIGLKSLWLAATPTHVWRIDPKRVEATRK